MPIQVSALSPAEKIEVILAKARRPCAHIVPIIYLEATNGQAYSIFGVPYGVTLTGEKRHMGFVYESSEGTTYGKRYSSETEARRAWELNEDEKAADFHAHLLASSPDELDRQYEFWRKR